MADEFHVGRDALRDAIALLRAEGLVETRRGARTKVRASVARERVVLPRGATVVARMPSPDERIELDVYEGVPVLVVDGRPYPADRFEFYTA